MRSQYKTTLLTWIVVYPIITGLLAILEPTLAGLPMPLRTLVLSSLMVPIMVYVAMPAARNVFRNWLEDQSMHPHSEPIERADDVC